MAMDKLRQLQLPWPPCWRRRNQCRAVSSACCTALPSCRVWASRDYRFEQTLRALATTPFSNTLTPSPSTPHTASEQACRLTPHAARSTGSSDHMKRDSMCAIVGDRHSAGPRRADPDDAGLGGGYGSNDDNFSADYNAGQVPPQSTTAVPASHCDVFVAVKSSHLLQPLICSPLRRIHYRRKGLKKLDEATATTPSLQKPRRPLVRAELEASDEQARAARGYLALAAAAFVWLRWTLRRETRAQARQIRKELNGQPRRARHAARGARAAVGRPGRVARADGGSQKPLEPGSRHSCRQMWPGRLRPWLQFADELQALAGAQRAAAERVGGQVQ